MPNSSLSVWDVKKDGAHFKRVFHGMIKLFDATSGAAAGASVDGMQADAFYSMQQSAAGTKVSKADFKAKCTWDAFKNILGATYMERFQDLDGDGDVDMDDVWIQLDTNNDGSLSIDEFVFSLLDRPAAWREVFEIFQEGGNISVDDLGPAIRCLGYNPDDATVMATVNKYDTNADGELDYQEWENIVKGQEQTDDAQLQKDIETNFAVLAKGDKDISTAELAYVMSALGSKLAKEAAEAMVKVVDSNGDGSVDYTEFLKMRGVPGATFEVTW